MQPCTIGEHLGVQARVAVRLREVLNVVELLVHSLLPEPTSIALAIQVDEHFPHIATSRRRNLILMSSRRAHVHLLCGRQAMEVGATQFLLLVLLDSTAVGTTRRFEGGVCDAQCP